MWVFQFLRAFSEEFRKITRSRPICWLVLMLKNYWDLRGRLVVCVFACVF